ncbi:MAG: preprotein translocase subunit SecE [Candidatus Dojkabacteria bacterium]|nr:preprotein translocase subunit SecE [Candidatus Dojkabacteria bacterium]
MKKIIKRITQPVTLILKEMKKVEWISFQQTVQYTFLILVISFFIGIIIVALDTVFFEGRNFIIEL